MKAYLILPFLLPALFAFSCQSTNQEKPKSEEQSIKPEKRKTVTTPRFPSPAATAVQTIGLSTVTINYSRPSIISPEGVDRTGKIWGKLVPFDFNFRPSSGGGKPKPWRAGANENTTISLSHDAQVEGQPIKAGKYGLHMAIHKNGGATVIFSNKSDAWGSFSYDESEDALRAQVETEEIPLTERLIYTIIDVDKTSGVVTLDWEKKRIPFRVEFDTHNMVLTDFREYLADTSELSWSDYNRAAAYCADNGVSLQEGMTWVEKSIQIERNYKNMSTKSKIFAEMDMAEEALKVKNQALELPTTDANDYYAYGTQLIRQGKIDQAMSVYERLRTKWPDHWLTAHGLARGYSAKGDYQSAMKYERKALNKAPEVNKGFMEWAIEKLEKGTDFN